MAFHGELGGDTTVARKNANSLYPAPLRLARHLPTRERARKPPLFTNVHSKKKRKLSCQYHISIYTPVFLKTS